MNIYETNERMYQFEHLHKYAAYLLSNHLDAYTSISLNHSFEIELPLLKFFKHLRSDELFELSKNSNNEFLTYLSQNNSKAHIESSLNRWLSNQLPVVGKLDVEARDITLVNRVRSKTLKTWLRQYSEDVEVMLKLNNEIDDLILGQNTSFTDAYIKMLKEKIDEEAHFSTNLINASPGIIFIYDLEEQKEIYINGKVEEIVGHSREDILNTPDLIGQLTHPDDQAVIGDFINTVIQDKYNNSHQTEYRFRNKKGGYNWLRSYATVYKRNTNGEAIQILGAAYEISNEKEIAASLKKREEQLLEAQAIGNIGSFDWDIVNDVSVSTPQVRLIFEANERQTLDEMMSKVHEDDKEKVKAALASAFEQGEYACEYRYLTTNGEKVIDSRGVVSFDEQGKPVSMVGTIQDTTEKKKIEGSLLQKTLELERSNEKLEQFASVASHDLKEPLRKIMTYSDLLVSSEVDGLPEKIKNRLNKITSAAKRMQDLIEGILAYSLLNHRVAREHYSLQEAVKEAVTNLEVKIKETGAVIISNGLPTAWVIPFQMQQLFQNLIANAIKFSKKNVSPVIVIKHSIEKSGDAALNLQPAREYLKIEVADNGIGFDAGVSSKIFGLFQRLHTRNDYEGSGLGLAICKKITENHAGSIQVKSTPGEGSIFTIILPMHF